MNKILLLLLFLTSFLFSFQLISINDIKNNSNSNIHSNSNKNIYSHKTVNNTKNIQQNIIKYPFLFKIPLSNSTKKLNTNNLKHTPFKVNIKFNGQPIPVYVGKLNPTIINFPAYIEKIEYIEGKGGFYVYKSGFRSGTQSLTILKKTDSNIDNVLYVTVLGKKIPLLLRYNKKYGVEPNNIINILLPNPNPNNTFNNNSNNSNNNTQILKIAKFKNLSFNTNIKAVNMIIRMINGTADQYFQKVNLRNINQPLGTKNKYKNKYIEYLFKEVFKNNKYFITAFFSNQIIPIALWKTKLLVYLSNKNKKLLTVYGIKTKWCNLTDTFYKQITIDDVKTIFGKNLLAVFHPFRKIPPHHCAYVYSVFYILK